MRSLLLAGALVLLAQGASPAHPPGGPSSALDAAAKGDAKEDATTDDAKGAGKVDAKGDARDDGKDDAKGAQTDERLWKLVWSDEFDRKSAPGGLPDPKRWSYETGLVRNNEKQWYTKGRKENARVEDGHLIIEARKEPFEKAQYTSASLHTRGKGEWKNVRVEVRAKVPAGRGTWPAIWMLGTNIGEVGWPRCGELDIMEHVGFDPDTIHANVHTRAYNHMRKNGKGSKVTVPKPHEDFHVYAMEWHEERIDFFVDGNRYFTYENEEAGEASWPFDKPCYLILNLAIGGAWGGQKGIDDSIFPRRFVVDYVRVHERRDPGR